MLRADGPVLTDEEQAMLAGDYSPAVATFMRLIAGVARTNLVIGALVATEIYDTTLPMVQLTHDGLARLETGAQATVLARSAPLDATVTVEGR